MSAPTYRGYHIEPYHWGGWEFWHDDYDGAPWETGGPPMDKRCGTGESVEDCIRQIDELEDDE